MRYLLPAAVAAVLFLPNPSHAFHVIATTRRRAQHLTAPSSARRSPSGLSQHQNYDQRNQYYVGGEGRQNDDADQYDDRGQYQQQQSEYYYDQGPQQGQDYAQDPQQQEYYQQHRYPVDDFPSEQQTPSLLITSNVQEELTRATSNVDVGGIDYLALARQRAAERRESINSLSSDADWLELAESKRRAMGDAAAYAADDDWESSLTDEGGSNDIAALGMRVEGGVMVTEGGIVVDIGAEGDDPKLLW
jgi:hypothetical protein